MPPESSCGYAFSQPARPTSFKRSSGERAPCPTLPPPTSKGSATLSSALRHGSRAASWNTKPMSRRPRAAAGASPNTVTVPLVGATKSATTRSKVDFPQPDGPSSERNPPSGTTTLIFSSAVTVPRSVVKRTEMSRHTTAAERAGSIGGSALASAATIALDLGPLVLGRLEDRAGGDDLELGRAG